MYAVVVGLGKLGYYLVKDLLAKGHEITVVEKRPDKCSWANEEFGNIVIDGDGCDPNVLEKAGVGRADVVVACTGHDEDNLVICHVAKTKHLQVRTVARVNNPKNETIFKKLGLDAVVNSTTMLAHVIEHELSAGDLVHLASLRRGGMEIVDVVLEKTSPGVGKKLMDLMLPPDCVVIAILRGEEAMMAKGDTQFEPGDEMIAVVSAEQEEELRNLLVPRKEGSVQESAAAGESQRGLFGRRPRK